MAESAAADAAKSNMTSDVFLQAVEQLAALVTKKDNAVSAIRHARAKFKGLGVDLEELDGALKDKKKHDDDPIAYDLALKTRERYRAWLLLPRGAQPDMDFGEQEPEHVERLSKYNAHKQGYDACKSGAPRGSNPHEMGTLAQVAFDNGWIDRERDEFEGEAVPDAKPKPGRPAKGAGPEMSGTQPESAAAAPKKRGRPRKVILDGATSGETIQ